MENKKAGAPKKFKEGLEVIKLVKIIPAKRKKECITAIEKIVEKDKR